MSGRYRALAIPPAVAFFAAFFATASAQNSQINDKDRWPALTDEERNWTKRGLNAVLLYRQEHSDLTSSTSTHFYRIKVLTREGRAFGGRGLPSRRVSGSRNSWIRTEACARPSPP